MLTVELQLKSEKENLKNLGQLLPQWLIQEEGSGGWNPFVFGRLMHLNCDTYLEAHSFYSCLEFPFYEWLDLPLSLRHFLRFKINDFMAANVYDKNDYF